MAYSQKKHKLAKTAESYGDYALLILGAVAFSALIGAIGDVTLLPDYSTNGLFAMSSNFVTIGSTTIVNGAAVASGAAVLMYGTNQTLDTLMDVQNAWKETEFAAFAGGALLPLAHEVSMTVSDLFVGEPIVQVLGVGVYAYCLFYLSDL